MSISQNDLLKGLNKEQSKAVVHDAGSLAVIAGAGSGKTSVLTKRIAWLSQTHHLKSYRILAVTFTNKAASEMKKRLSSLGLEHVDQMWVGTFHGLAHRFLRRHHDVCGLSAHFQILDAQEQEKVIKSVFKANDWSTEEFDPKDVLRFINAQKDAGLRPHQCSTQNGVDSFFRDAYQQYQDLCDKNSWVDFGELLLRCYELFANHPEICLKYQEQFAHILVDEFQDTNDIQYNWIKNMSASGTSVPVTVVGDMDQSIYSWRGAKMTNVQRFVDEFSSVDMIKLEQNYRSTHHILAAANAVIVNNNQRIPKSLWTAAQSGEPVVLFEAMDEREEATFAVAKAIAQYKKTSKWADTAILYRSNAQSRIIEEACIKQSIPYKIHGGIRFFERSEIKDALAHLSMIVDLNNDLMIERALTSPSKGFGPKALDALKSQSFSKQCSWASLLNQESFVKINLTSKARAAWEMWRDLWKEKHDWGTLEEKIRWCVESTGLLKHYQEIDKKDKTDRAENLKELISVARRYTQGRQETGIDTVLEFLASAALEAENATKSDDDALQLMTIHSSKGLEFPCVCAIGWDDGLFPSSQSIGDVDRMEEERRLAYVAITRAEKQLFISGAVDRRQYGQVMRLQPSRFLAELPQGSVVWARNPMRKTKEFPIQSGAQQRLGPSASSSSPRASYWNVGEKVVHPIFGNGKVLRVDGAGKNDRVLIAFEDGEKRILLPQLAKIEKAG